MSWNILLNPLPSTVSGVDDPSLAPLALSVTRNVQINRQTMVSELFHYTPNTQVEYPKTASNNHAIGHLFNMDLSKEWVSPARSFAYSQGRPEGTRNFVFTKALVDSNGQGVKICPSASPEIFLQTHTSGSRFEQKLYLEWEHQEQVLSLDRDLIEKTLNYWACLRDYGCGRDLQEDTVYNTEELERYNTIHASPKKKSRGHEPKATCQGRIGLQYTPTGRPFLCCEHFDSETLRKHFCDFAVASKVYHTKYLLALCNADSNEIHKWEKLAFDKGYGPLAPCTTVRNFSTMRVDCPQQHWGPHSSMLMTEMVVLPCKSTFHIYKPLPEYRHQCPRILVVCSGEHVHPIPASTKTPPEVQLEILDMLCTPMVKDLADMTPRRFLSHPIAQAFIRRKVPFIKEPQLSDLSNLCFPLGQDGKSLDVKDRMGILHWAMDQGRGPAKGMALYLHELAGKLPPYTHDLHQPHQYIQELEPYEHLHRVARLCTAHIHRNIGNSKTIPDSIKPKMRSLMCITHPSWDKMIAQIESSSKAGRGENWVANKVSSKFAFEAMCQEKSFIPLDIWRAGLATTNLVESAHWRVYLEGLECSLTSAVEKSEYVDRLRMSSSNMYLHMGIYTTNMPNDHLHSALVSHRRKANAETKRMDREDKQIVFLHEKLAKAKAKVDKAADKLDWLQSISMATPGNITAARSTLEKAQKTYLVAFEKLQEMLQKCQGSRTVKFTELQ
ncbi:hypothetical protein BT96DRAFT_994780 [Gymnopus androsaceus JB14]|uniref:Uncharacterized protein n=1 Tax=Gymnopus androsaceus JB14 TaxID=1447944 RepID=A0A6A4HLW0_9AGAR|nr:hypothetical protein BT96DRAFT_994780 [Gymnopus androsaceus JB14]